MHLSFRHRVHLNCSSTYFKTLLVISVPLLAVASAPLFAQGTKLWTQSRFEEFEKGTPQGVEISSDGKLRSGPVASEVLTTPSSFVWSVAADEKSGTVYLGTGAPATVLKAGPDKTANPRLQTLFETKALAVQVVRLGPDGALYAATIPDGKVYRIKPGTGASKPLDESTAEVVFDLAKAEVSSDQKKADAKASGGDKKDAENKSHYIWDMTFDSAGKLYVATGGPGVVYRVNVADARVNVAGAHPGSEVFFKSDEQHIRVLAWDKEKNLLAGSDGSGLVYRIGPNASGEGKGYVLFSAPRREVTALAVGVDGTVYAADVGDKSHNPLPPLPIQSGGSSITISFVQPGSVQAANASSSLPEGTEIFALKPDAAPRKLWSGKDEVVYQLAYTSDGLTALTGNRGRILRINTADGSFSDIAHLEAQQAVSMSGDSNGGWLVATANTGKLYKLASGSDEANNAQAHSYASDVLDAGATARWGRVEAEPGSRGYQMWTRSGNVEQPVRSAKDWGWSAWQQTVDDRVVSPVGRFLQWKAVLKDGGEVAGVGINYLAVNAAPAVDDVVVVPGARITPQPPQGNQPTVQIAFSNPSPNAGAVFDPNAANASSASSPIQAQKDRGAVTVRWAAHDDNGDELTYDVFLRGDGEHLWRPLKKGLTERVYSFDAASFPDGGYQIKVVASDAPSHTPGELMTGELVSDRFELDTTAPVISGLKAGAPAPIECIKAPCPQRMSIALSFEARDAASPISKAEYSLDAGPWQYIEPVGGLSDSKEERYSVSVPLPGGIEVEPQGNPKTGVEIEHLITVRAYDRHENMATAKVVVPASGLKPQAK
jgi:hypothetical protein